MAAASILPDSQLFVPLSKARTILNESVPDAMRQKFRVGEDLISLFVSHSEKANPATSEAVAVVLCSLYSRIQIETQMLTFGDDDEGVGSGAANLKLSLEVLDQELRSTFQVSREDARRRKSEAWLDQMNGNVASISSQLSARKDPDVAIIDTIDNLLENGVREPGEESDVLFAALEELIGAEDSALVQWLGLSSLPKPKGKLTNSWLIGGGVAIALLLIIGSGLTYYFRGNGGKIQAEEKPENKAILTPSRPQESFAGEIAVANTIAAEGKRDRARVEMIKLADQGSAEASLWLAKDALANRIRATQSLHDETWRTLGQGGTPDARSFYVLRVDNQNDLAKAKFYLQQSRKLNDSAPAIILESQLLTSEGKSAEAMSLIEEGSKKWPELEVSLAAIYRANGDEQKAVAAVERAKRFFMGRTSGDNSLIGDWIDLALIEFFLKNNDAGIRLIDEGKKKFPAAAPQFDRVLVWHSFNSAVELLGGDSPQQEVALDLVTRACSLISDKITLWKLISALGLASKQFPALQEEFGKLKRELISRVEESSETFLALAIQESVKKDHLAALNYYEKALALNPSSVSTLTQIQNNLAWTLVQLYPPETDRALELINAAINSTDQAMSSRISFFDTRAAVYVAAGQWGKALADLEILLPMLRTPAYEELRNEVHEKIEKARSQL